MMNMNKGQLQINELNGFGQSIKMVKKIISLLYPMPLNITNIKLSWGGKIFVVYRELFIKIL